jgi:hypothetical protein
MRIWLINPNTTQAMTAKIEDCARAVVGSETSVMGVTSEQGPESVECHYDEAMSVPGMLQAIRRGEQNSVDGYVIACFGDPGLDASREVAAGPVIGIAEAAMHTASHLGRGFSIVTTLGRTTGRAADLAERYGMQRFCRGIHACEIPGARPGHRPQCAQGHHRGVSRRGGGGRLRRGGAGVRRYGGPMHADLRRTRRSGRRRRRGGDVDRAITCHVGAAHV